MVGTTSPAAIAHVISTDVRSDSFELLEIFSSRLNRTGFTHHFAALDRPAAESIERRFGLTGTAIFHLGGSGIGAGLALKRWLARRPVSIVHGWGEASAVPIGMAQSQGAAYRTCLSLDVPLTGARFNRSWQALSGNTPHAVVCTTQTVQRSAIESGVAPNCCVVIRPGVDFGAINEVRRLPSTGTGLPDAPEITLTAPGAVWSGSGHKIAIWAAALFREIYPKTRIVIPCRAGENSRVERFARALHVENLIKYAGERASALDMLPEANAAIFAAEEEISMTPVAWCMAAGLPIIATAIPGVAEMLAHDHNALLVGDPTPKAFCERILSLRDDAQLRARLSQTVRGHAYEAFGVRRMVDQFEKLYDNLLAGRPAGEQILDSALVD